jgi:hypothetical protein
MWAFDGMTKKRLTSNTRMSSPAARRMTEAHRLPKYKFIAKSLDVGTLNENIRHEFNDNWTNRMMNKVIGE